MKYFYLSLIIFLIFLSIFLCSFAANAEEGIASFYGNGEKLNKHTANGEVFNPEDLTCATYNYNFNTILKVTNVENNKFVLVRVNDRGPNKRLGRVIDLSKRAFQEISDLRKGLIKVKIERR